MSTISVVSMTDDVIFGQRPCVIEKHVPTSEILRPKGNKKTKHTSTYTRKITPNRTYRQKGGSNPIENHDNKTEPENIVIITEKAKSTKTCTTRKLKHTRMQPMTSGQRRTAKQTLHETCGSNRQINGIYLFDNFWWSRYNIFENIEEQFPDIFNLPLADTQERITPYWQKEIQKAANELKNAKKALKSAKNSSLEQEYIDMLQEDFNIALENFYQLVAHHQKTFNQESDYTKQMRANRRQAKQLMQQTSTEPLALVDLYELDVTYVLSGAPKETLQQNCMRLQKQEQRQRFADTFRSVYYPGRRTK